LPSDKGKYLRRSAHDLTGVDKALDDLWHLIHPQTQVQLPTLPTNTLDWIEKARPLVGKVVRDFRWEPFWIPVYEDNYPNIVILAARQTFKSTFGTDKLACYMTSHPNSEVTYVVDRADRANAWSKQRYRKDTFIKNPILKQFLISGKAAVGEINGENDAVTYVRTDENEYNNVQGMTNEMMFFDECQYQELQFRREALNSMVQTKGQAYYTGIGGEKGSEWYRIWKASDQREWVFADKYWREKLKFDEAGYLANEHPENIVAGRWVAQEPNNREYRGYHMSQTMFARIPLTINDAINKYKTRPDNSIEHQQKYSPLSIYTSHTIGDFFKAERRPITPEMVEACYDYSTSLLSPQEVRQLKHKFGNKVMVYGGTDWGSGPAASYTVPCIMLYWKITKRYQIAWIERMDQMNPLDQVRYIAELFGKEGYNVDLAVGDYGYGDTKVKMMQDGGRDSRDNKYKGLGRRRFIGCRTIGDETKPEMIYTQESDEHGTELGKLQIDKTTTIQGFVDIVGRYVADPDHPDNEKLKKTVLMIPYAKDYEVSFLMEDMTSITRKDLEKQQDVRIEDPRQRARKEFNHPPDTVMAMIYCIVASNQYDPDAFKILPIKKR